MRYDGTSPPASRVNVYNGEQLITTNTESSASIPAYTSPLVVGATHVGDNRAFGGYISEIIIYRKAVNSAERILVNNYLSAKYNIALTSNDVYTMDDPVNGDYDHEVAGIGRIDALNFSNEGQGSSIVRVLNPNNLNDNEFFMWGHDNGIPQAIEFIDVPPPVYARFDRVWRASELNTIGTPVNVGAVNMRFDLNGLGPVNPSHLRLLVDVNNNGVFADDPSIAGATDLGGGIYQFTAVSQIQHSFRFTIARIDAATPLPVELSEWTIECTEKGVLAKWTAASESNNNYFILEKSKDGKNWMDVAKIKGAGNSNIDLQYNYLDKISLGLVYYRLKQVDFNGKITRFNVQSANCGQNEWDKINIYPNPTNEILNIEPPSNDYNVQLLDMTGKHLRSIQLTERTTKIDVSALANGIYILTISNDNFKHVKRIVIQN